jgi:hypothetical protein
MAKEADADAESPIFDKVLRKVASLPAGHAAASDKWKRDKKS